VPGNGESNGTHRDATGSAALRDLYIEGRRLSSALRAVELVERALREK
jgi:hypothetical protein